MNNISSSGNVNLSFSPFNLINLPCNLKVRGLKIIVNRLIILLNILLKGHDTWILHVQRLILSSQSCDSDKYICLSEQGAVDSQQHPFPRRRFVPVKVNTSSQSRMPPIPQTDFARRFRIPSCIVVPLLTLTPSPSTNQHPSPY